MQLAPITPIATLRTDAAGLAATSTRLEHLVRRPLDGGVPVDPAMRARLDATIDAATSMLRSADATATSAVVWEGDQHLSAAAGQAREGVEELYDVVSDAISALRDATAEGLVSADTADANYELRRAAVQLHGFATDLVETIDAGLGSKLESIDEVR